MSYAVFKETVKTDIFIDHKKTDAAFAFLKDGLLTENMNRGEQPDDRLAWISTSEVLRTNTLEELMEACRWNAAFDDLGNLIDLTFSGIHKGEENLIFRFLAPFVKNRGRIEFVSEGYIDNTRHIYFFKKGKIQHETQILREQ